MTATHTSVPDIKAYLHDTLLPAALANLATTITVGTSTLPLRAPQLCYGRWAGQNPPPAYVMIGPTTSGADIPAAVMPSSAARYRNESYTVQILVWYSIGDTGANAQRVATESAYAVFRAIAEQVENSTAGFVAILGGGSTVQLRAVQDSEYDAAEGRGCGLVCSLDIKSRI